MTNGRLRDAIRLYQWNIELSGAVYELLHFFEVTLRNAMDTRLCEWNSEQKNSTAREPHAHEWLMDPAPLLVRLTRGEIAGAKRRATNASKFRQGPRRGAVEHDDILANLSLGTWHYLLPSKDPGNQLLWSEALEGAFPHRRRDPLALVRAVDGVYRIRNRIAHLEPLLRQNDVRNQVTNIRTVLGEIDPAFEQWAMGWQRVTRVLSQRPTVAGP